MGFLHDHFFLSFVSVVNLMSVISILGVIMLVIVDDPLAVLFWIYCPL